MRAHPSVEGRALQARRKCQLPQVHLRQLLLVGGRDPAQMPVVGEPDMFGIAGDRPPVDRPRRFHDGARGRRQPGDGLPPRELGVAYGTRFLKQFALERHGVEVGRGLAENFEIRRRRVAHAVSREVGGTDQHALAAAVVLGMKARMQVERAASVEHERPALHVRSAEQHVTGRPARDAGQRDIGGEQVKQSPQRVSLDVGSGDHRLVRLATGVGERIPRGHDSSSASLSISRTIWSSVPRACLPQSSAISCTSVLRFRSSI